MTKKYIIEGVMEYHAVLRAGSVPVHVHFKGGTLTGYGVSPSEYTTDNAFIQHVIEHSPEFANGKIKLSRVYGNPSPVKEAAKEESKDVAQSASEVSSLRKVSVPSIADAKQYLVDNFGEIPSDLRSRASIDKRAAAHGVVFEMN